MFHSGVSSKDSAEHRTITRKGTRSGDPQERFELEGWLLCLGNIPQKECLPQKAPRGGAMLDCACGGVGTVPRTWQTSTLSQSDTLSPSVGFFKCLLCDSQTSGGVLQRMQCRQALSGHMCASSGAYPGSGWKALCLVLTGFSLTISACMKKSMTWRLICRAHPWPLYVTHTLRLLAMGTNAQITPFFSLDNKNTFCLTSSRCCSTSLNATVMSPSLDPRRKVYLEEEGDCRSGLGSRVSDGS